MIFRILYNTIKQGFVGFWRNKQTTFSTIISNTCVFLILGIIIILILSANNVMRELKSDSNLVQIFLIDDLTDVQIRGLEKNINAMPEVLSVSFVSKEQGLEATKKEWGDDAYLLDIMEENPIPDSFEIKLKDISLSASLIEKLEKYKEIESANYHEELMAKTIKIAQYVRMGGFSLIVILLIISVVIVSNTTKIAIAARRKEINIMKYIGATNEYIKAPFVVEAMIIGFISAIIAVFVISFSYKLIYENADEEFYRLLTYYLGSPKILIQDIAIIFGTIGLGIGAIGSILSLRKYVRV